MEAQLNYQIKDSYKVKSKKDMEAKLLQIRDEEEDNAVKHRAMSSMISEWRAHNLLYALHIFRSHTKDVDFEFPLKTIYAVLFFILSVFYPHR